MNCCDNCQTNFSVKQNEEWKTTCKKCYFEQQNSRFNNYDASYMQLVKPMEIDEPINSLPVQTAVHQNIEMSIEQVESSAVIKAEERLQKIHLGLYKATLRKIQKPTQRNINSYEKWNEKLSKASERLVKLQFPKQKIKRSSKALKIGIQQEQQSISTIEQVEQSISEIDETISLPSLSAFSDSINYGIETSEQQDTRINFDNLDISIRFTVQKIYEQFPLYSKQQMFNYLMCYCKEQFINKSIYLVQQFCISRQNQKFRVQLQNKPYFEEYFVYSNDQLIGLKTAINQQRDIDWYNTFNSTGLKDVVLGYSHPSLQIDTLSLNIDMSCVLKRGFVVALEQQKHRQNTFIFRLDGRYGDRRIECLTIQQAQQAFDKYQVNQLISPYINSKIRLYFDLDIFKVKETINKETDQNGKTTFTTIITEKGIKDQEERHVFLETFINCTKEALALYSKKSLENNQVQFNVLASNYEVLRSCHVYTNISIEIKHIQFFYDILLGQLINKTKYTKLVLEDIFDKAVYPAPLNTEFTQPKSLRIIGSDKYSDVKKQSKKQNDSDSDSDNEFNINKPVRQLKQFTRKIVQIAPNSSRNQLNYFIHDIEDCIQVSRSFCFIDQPHYPLQSVKCQEDDESVEEIDQEDNLEYFLNKQLEDVSITKKQNGRIVIDYKTGQNCPVCKVIHSNSHLYTYTKDNNQYLNCFRSKVHSAKSIKLTGSDQIEYQKIKRPLITEIDHYLKDEFEYTTDGFRETFDFDVWSNKLTFVKACVGSGKTSTLARNIMMRPNCRVLFISVRVSFSCAIVKTLNSKYNLDFYNYNDLDKYGMKQANRLMCQVESITKLGMATPENGYDLVILDEIESILVQTQSGAGNSGLVFPCLSSQIQSAKHVVVMDAFLTKATAKFIKNLAQTTIPQYVINKYQHYQNKPVSIYQCDEQEEDKSKKVKIFNQYVEKLYDAVIVQKKKVFSMCTSRTYAEKTEKYLISYGLKASEILVLHGKNEDEVEHTGVTMKHIQQKRMIYENIDCLDQYRVVIFTKTLTIGVDSMLQDFKTGIHLYVGYANGMDIAQGIHRFRAVQEHHIFYRYQHPHTDNKFSDIKQTPFLEMKRLYGSAIVLPQFVQGYESNIKEQLLINTAISQLEHNGIEILEALLRSMGYSIDKQIIDHADKVKLEQLTVERAKLDMYIPINQQHIEYFELSECMGSNVLISDKFKDKQFGSIQDLQQAMQKMRAIKSFLKQFFGSKINTNENIYRLAQSKDSQLLEYIGECMSRSKCVFQQDILDSLEKQTKQKIDRSLIDLAEQLPLSKYIDEDILAISLQLFCQKNHYNLHQANDKAFVLARSAVLLFLEIDSLDNYKELKNVPEIAMKFKTVFDQPSIYGKIVQIMKLHGLKSYGRAVQAFVSKCGFELLSCKETTGDRKTVYSISQPTINQESNDRIKQLLI